MTERSSWCHVHWQQVIATFATLAPLNGIMLSTEIITAYIIRKAEKLGGVMPGPHDTHALNQMMTNDSPLCCWLGEDTLTQLKARCILPAKYRHLPPGQGHVLHMVELGKGDGMTIGGQAVTGDG